MAIYRSGPLAGGISGAVGGAVFVNARGSKVLRRTPITHRKPQGPLGFALSRPHVSVNRARAGWLDLDDPSRLSWNATASQVSFTNRLGEARPISGYALYMKVNIQRALRLLAPMTVGPGIVRPQALASVVIAASVANGLDVTIDSPLDPTARLMLVYGSLHWGTAAPKFWRDFRLLGTANFTKAATLELISLWDPIFGDLRLGQHLALKLRPWIIDTWPGSPWVQPATVVA